MEDHGLAVQGSTRLSSGKCQSVVDGGGSRLRTSEPRSSQYFLNPFRISALCPTGPGFTLNEYK